MSDYTIFLISNKPDALRPIEESISPEKITYFDGSGYPSFSNLVNSCVASSPTETVIIASSKVLPTADQVRKTLDLLEKGYAFVALYRFAFFGLKKELMRRIGMMDERFLGGWYEDDDYYIRLVESRMPVYITQEVNYFRAPSGWRHTEAINWFHSKWPEILQKQHIERIVHEERYSHDLGAPVEISYLPFEESHVTCGQPGKYMKMRVLETSLSVFDK
jgi:hypothetical protein